MESWPFYKGGGGGGGGGVPHTRVNLFSGSENTALWE